METLSSTLDVIGTIMIAYAALSVHDRVRRDKKIDESVFRTMKWERSSGILGVMLIILGYFIGILNL